MPELPDVEVFRRYMRRRALHRRVDTVSVRAERVLAVSPSTLRRRLRGHRLESSRRHGKLLFVGLDDSAGALVLHFGMTGFLRWYREAEDEPPHARLVLELDDGHKLAYDNQRRFGKVDLADDPETYVEQRGLGPDALSASRDVFTRRIADRSGGIKAALMDQRVLAGIGNIYSDEILFHARLHPESRTQKLSDGDLDSLHDRTQYVLRQAIAARVDVERMPASWLLPHRRRGATCPRCGGEVHRRTVAGRSAWLCPRCQKQR